MANNRENIDPSTITDDESAFDLFLNTIGVGIARDAFQGKTRFHAIVLTEPLPISAEYASIGMPVTDPANPTKPTMVSAGRFKFRARILDDPNPHGIYPDPCDPTIANNVAEALKRIKLHTEFYSSENSSAVRPKKDDIVIVELRPNFFSYNLMEGEYVGLVDKSTASAKGYAARVCEGSRAAFSGGGGGYTPMLGTVGFPPGKQTGGGVIGSWYKTLSSKFPHDPSMIIAGPGINEGAFQAAAAQAIAFWAPNGLKAKGSKLMGTKKDGNWNPPDDVKALLVQWWEKEAGAKFQFPVGKDGPWSAVTQAFLFGMAGPPFLIDRDGNVQYEEYSTKRTFKESGLPIGKFSLQAHVRYSTTAYTNRTRGQTHGWLMFTVNENVLIQIGDVFINSRATGGSSHGDTVFQIGPDEQGELTAWLIGGNLSSTLRVRKVGLKPDGTVDLTRSAEYLVIDKWMGGVNERVGGKRD